MYNMTVAASAPREGLLQVNTMIVAAVQLYIHLYIYIYTTHVIAQRPAQMRMCSHDDNKEKNLRHPFWVEIPRFQHKKKKG